MRKVPFSLRQLVFNISDDRVRFCHFSPQLLPVIHKPVALILFSMDALVEIGYSTPAAGELILNVLYSGLC